MNLANHERQLCATALRVASCSEPDKHTRAAMEQLANKIQPPSGSYFHQNSVSYALSECAGIAPYKAGEIIGKLSADSFVQLVLALHAGNGAAVDAIIGAAAFM